MIRTNHAWSHCSTSNERLVSCEPFVPSHQSDRTIAQPFIGRIAFHRPRTFSVFRGLPSFRMVRISFARPQSPCLSRPVRDKCWLVRDNSHSVHAISRTFAIIHDNSRYFLPPRHTGLSFGSRTSHFRLPSGVYIPPT